MKKRSDKPSHAGSLGSCSFPGPHSSETGARPVPALGALQVPCHLQLDTVPPGGTEEPGPKPGSRRTVSHQPFASSLIKLMRIKSSFQRSFFSF